MAKTQDRIMTTLCSYLLPNTEVISNKTPMWSVSGKWEQGLLSPQPLLLCQPAVKMMAPLMTTPHRELVYLLNGQVSLEAPCRLLLGWSF